MAFFTSDKKVVLNTLKKHEWSGEAQLQELLEKLAGFELKPADILWMLTDRDRTLRTYGAQLFIQGDFQQVAALLLKEALSLPHIQRKALISVLPRLRDNSILNRIDEMLVDKDEERRNLAVDVVLSYPASQVMAQLAQLIRHEDSEYRSRALTRFLEDNDGSVSESRLKQLITPLLTDPEEKLRIRAVQALAKNADDELVDLLLARLRAEHGVARQVIAKVIDQWVVEDRLNIEDKLVPLLSDGDEAIRNIVIELVQHAKDPARVVQKIILFSKSLMGWMRERIHETIKRVGESLLDPMIELMYHEDPQIRSSALMFATNFNDPKMVEAVCHLLHDKDWWTRVVAMDTLGRLGDERAVDALIKSLEDEEVRWSAVDALTRIGSPRSLAPVARLLSDNVKEIRLEVIRALEVYNDPRVLPLLKRTLEGDPEVDVRERALEAYKSITERNRLEMDEKELRAAMIYRSKSARRIDALLTEMRKIGSSDLHLTAHSPPYIRLEGELRCVGKRAFTPQETREMLLEVMTEAQRQEFFDFHQVDFCYDIPGTGRYRCNVFEQQLGTCGVFRSISAEIPTFTEIRLPPHLSDIANYHQGLVIVSGTSGSGKTTTLAALVNLLNETKKSHVITLEDPIEYVHPFKNCLINQRQIKTHTRSYAAALRAALREDPDVIVVGDMRDNETMALATTAAETGHLVIATMNTTSAVKSIVRIIESFPPREQPQVRAMLSESLKVVVSQSLMRKKDQRGRVACFEVLMITSAVANLIRDNRMFLIPSLMQIGRNIGMATVDAGLMELVNAGLITPEDAYMRADKKEEFESLVSRGFLEGSVKDG
ncbi:MAG: PilT/PilU family type 4a pilus ATPase [Myxococcales bacterium]|nr:PilT/PilU family type 4a pilus ATPase [Myxococcales bacterium]